LGRKSSLSISQVALQNWAAGGDESVSGLGILNVTANYTSNDSSLIWQNALDANYGLQKINQEPTRKTDDILEFSSKIGKNAVGNWYYTGLLGFQTQFQEGYAVDDTSGIPTSDFMSPAYIVASLGMDYNDNKSFSLLLSPITSKTTVVNNQRLADEGAFGVDPGKKMRFEVGGYVKTQYVFSVVENVETTLKLNMFSNYLEDPQNIDVESEINISMQVNSYLSATLRANLKYDHDVTFINSEGEKVNSYVQFKEILGVTLSYKFL